jgi:hypothetical protein
MIRTRDTPPLYRAELYAKRPKNVKEKTPSGLSSTPTKHRLAANRLTGVE